MSCCGPFPPPSSEPRYQVHPLLMAQVVQWEHLCGGITSVVEDAVSNGNMDALHNGVAPPYSLPESFEVAYQCLESTLLERERLRLLKQGPWMVRLGLSKAKPALAPDQQEALEACRAQGDRIIAQLTTPWQAAG